MRTKQPITKAHCNKCFGTRNHAILHSEETSWKDDECGIWGSDCYETLRFLGCENIKLRHTNNFSEVDDATVIYFPPAISRPVPTWLNSVFSGFSADNEFIVELLREIYSALHNNLQSLAAMGIRSLLEKIMISKVTDLGTFAKNIAEFERMGFVSKSQRERMEAILDAGHAAIHRDYTPRAIDVITLVDITEHIIESVFLHDAKISALKKRVPARPSKQR